MIIDFHSHSTCSDGTLNPADLIQRAAANGVTHFSITDHDTLGAYREIDLNRLPLSLIPGVEFSCMWQEKTIHIIGLNIQLDSSVLLSAEEIQSKHRECRAIAIDHKLRKLGIIGALEGARALAHGQSVGRPHFAQYLIEQKIVKTEKAAFNHFLGEQKCAFAKPTWPSLEEVVSWIHGSSGIAIIAHPHRYNFTRRKLCKLLDSFVSHGGQGIEVLSGHQSPQTFDNLKQLAHLYNLAISIGSDFHSPQQKWLKLGMHPVPPHCVGVWELFSMTPTPVEMSLDLTNQDR